jgi:hypothetical protein
MTPQELNQAIREIGALSRKADRNEWELGDRLRAFSPLEYEQVLPRLIEITGWSRQRLTGLRTTAIRWPAEKRLPNERARIGYALRYRDWNLSQKRASRAL